MPVFSRFLRYFIAVAQQGSIRKASEELRIAASAIDRQILQGEKLLGAPLFERLPTGLRLTATGELLLTAAQRWNRDFNNLTVQIDDLKGLRRGKVDCFVPDALTKGVVPRLLGTLRQTHPGIVISMHIRDNREIADLLIKGEADFALIFDPGNVRELLVRAHADFPIGFVTLPGHPIAQLEHARFSLSADFPMIVPSDPLAMRRQIKLLESETQIALNPVALADDIQMIKSLVSENVGIGILSYIDVMEEVHKKDLAFTKINQRTLSPLTLTLCVDRSRQLSTAARLVIAEVEKIFVEDIRV